MAARRTWSAMLHPQGNAAATDAEHGTLRERTAAGAARRQPPFPGAQYAHLAAMAEEVEEGPVDLSRRDDAESHRGTKIKSEMNKRDRKGKSEQVTKYITKVGARIKCLLGRREDTNTYGTVKRSGLREAAEEHDSSSHTVARSGDLNPTNEEMEEQASSSAWDWDEWTGIVPFIYRAIKARRARSRSTGSPPAGRFGAREEDGAWEENRWGADDVKVSTPREMTHASLEEPAGKVGISPEWRPGAASRGRGGGVFSCIVGAGTCGGTPTPHVG